MSLAVARHDGTADAWDAFVHGRPGWTHFHLYGWKRVIESVFRHECLYLSARDASGALRGVLPLVRVRSVLLGHYLVSMPFLNGGGPLGDDEAVRALVARAEEIMREHAVELLELRSRVPLPLDLPVSHRKITVVLDLPRTSEALWAALSSEVRNQVRRPQKDGVEVRFGPEQVDPFFAVFSRHMRDLGTPTHPLALFRAIAETFGPEAWFGCAWYGGRPVAAGAGFRWGRELELTWVSAPSAYNRIAAKLLLCWTFMERAIAEGVTLFNFGRCSPGSGTHGFRLQWGSRDEPLWWYRRARTATTATPSPDGHAFAWGARLWRRLPLPVATALGPRIARYLP